MLKQVQVQDHWGRQAAPRRGINRVTAGIALSIAAHGALLFAFRYHAPLPKADHTLARESMVIHLLAPPPPPPPAPAQAVPDATIPPAPVKNTPRQAQTARRTRPERPVTEVIALPQEAQAAPAKEPRFSVAPQPSQPQGEPAFDPEAAKKFARSIATKPDPARAGMAVAQIPEKPLATETRAARAIASAKRRDCKDGLPGGLLGPLIMLLDKKDSGCKW